MVPLRSSRSLGGAAGTRKLASAPVVLLTCLLALGLAACGSTTSATNQKLAADTGPKGDAAWQKLVKDAKAEGEVVFYGSHGEDTMNKLAAAFDKQYGIKVKVFRAADSDLEPK